MTDLILPKELSESNLTLEEIGAIFVLYSFHKISEEYKSYWSTNDNLNLVGESLIDRGIVKFSKNDDDEAILDIDLTKVNSPVKDFWEIWEFDDNENQILSHDDIYGDEDGLYRYELHPELYDTRLVWRLKHSEYGEVEGYYPIDSLEDAEQIVKEIISNGQG